MANHGVGDYRSFIDGQLLPVLLTIVASCGLCNMCLLANSKILNRGSFAQS